MFRLSLFLLIIYGTVNILAGDGLKKNQAPPAGKSFSIRDKLASYGLDVDRDILAPYHKSQETVPSLLSSSLSPSSRRLRNESKKNQNKKIQGSMHGENFKANCSNVGPLPEYSMWLTKQDCWDMCTSMCQSDNVTWRTAQNQDPNYVTSCLAPDYYGCFITLESIWKESATVRDFQDTNDASASSNGEPVPEFMISMSSIQNFYTPINEYGVPLFSFGLADVSSYQDWSQCGNRPVGTAAKVSFLGYNSSELEDYKSSPQSMFDLDGDNAGYYGFLSSDSHHDSSAKTSKYFFWWVDGLIYQNNILVFDDYEDSTTWNWNMAQAFSNDTTNEQYEATACKVGWNVSSFSTPITSYFRVGEPYSQLSSAPGSPCKSYSNCDTCMEGGCHWCGDIKEDLNIANQIKAKCGATSFECRVPEKNWDACAASHDPHPKPPSPKFAKTNP